MRNEKECVCSAPNCCNILISGKIIKEMPGSVASGTHCIILPHISALHLHQYETTYLIFCGPCIVIYLRHKNQQEALFYSQDILIVTSICFEQVYCPSSGVTFLYIQQLVCVMCLCWLAASRMTPNAVYTEMYLLMMSSKPARNIYRLITEIN